VEGSWPFRAQTAERGARSATPGAGVLPAPVFGFNPLMDSWLSTLGKSYLADGGPAAGQKMVF
jgi:hypothetical protein